MDLNSIVYVAGHAGLIGSAMVRALERLGYRRIVTRSRRDLDLQDTTQVRRFFDQLRPEYVVLAAGRVGGIMENRAFPADLMNENMAIQLNVLRESRRIGVKRLIFFGSSCMYPRDCPQPMAEEALLAGKPEPTSLPYAMSKLAGTYLCLAYNKQDQEGRFIPVIPNSTYGPRDNFDPDSGHVLSALMTRFHQAKERRTDSVTLWGTGNPRREFIHADDVASACIHLLRLNASTLELPINIGVGTEVSIKDLANEIAGIVGYRGRLDWDTSKPDGAPRKLLDSGRLRALGWQPIVSLSKGLEMTYQWYLENEGIDQLSRV